MDWTKIAIGAVLPVLPLYIFFEAKTEKRVRQEVQVIELAKDVQAMVKELDEYKERTRGQFWILEADVRRLDKEIAVKHQD